MKKFLNILGLAVFALILVGCGNSSAGSASEEMPVVKLGVANDTNKEVWEDVADRLMEKENIALDVIHINDYHQLNRGLSEGDLDANAYQYITFLAEYNEASGESLRPAAYTYIPPYGIYSDESINSLEEIPNGAKVAVTNDPANLGNALKQLEVAGLIEIADSQTQVISLEDITSNPLNLEFIELEGAQVPRALQNEDVELMVTGTVTAKDGGFEPEDALYIEDPEQTSDFYKIVFVTREESLDDPVLQKVIDEFQSEETIQFAEENFEGTYVPTWSEDETPVEDYETYVEDYFVE